MATQVDIAGTNITARQMREFFRLAAIPDSHVNRETFQSYLTKSDVICVPRPIERSIFPSFVNREWLTDEFMTLQRTGPSDYSLGSLQSSLHPKQEQGVATGHEVYEHQKGLGLEGCLGLADLLAIQQLGIAAFRRHFRGKAVFGWKSVVQYDDGALCVPDLLVCDGRVALNWRWLGIRWGVDYPALRFVK